MCQMTSDQPSKARKLPVKVEVKTKLGSAGFKDGGDKPDGGDRRRSSSCTARSRSINIGHVHQGQQRTTATFPVCLKIYQISETAMKLGFDP